MFTAESVDMCIDRVGVGLQLLTAELVDVFVGAAVETEFCFLSDGSERDGSVLRDRRALLTAPL